MAIAQTTLAAAIATAGATTCTVRDVGGFASASDASDLVLIDSEFILVGAGMGTTSWSSLTRAYAGSTAAAHADGATVTRIERGWTSLVDVKDWTEIPASDTVDDSDLLLCIEATNAYVTQCVGAFLGPSTDTTRTYRRLDPAEGGRTLMVPYGIRSFTTLELRRSSLDAWETVTSGDVILGPPSWDLPLGAPYGWVEFIDDPVGAWHEFPVRGEARFTGAQFGWAAAEPQGAAIARTAVTRMWGARDEGALRNPTPSKFVYDDDLDVLRALGMAHVMAGVS